MSSISPIPIYSTFSPKSFPRLMSPIKVTIRLSQTFTTTFPIPESIKNITTTIRIRGEVVEGTWPYLSGRPVISSTISTIPWIRIHFEFRIRIPSKRERLNSTLINQPTLELDWNLNPVWSRGNHSLVFISLKLSHLVSCQNWHNCSFISERWRSLLVMICGVIKFLS